VPLPDPVIHLYWAYALARAKEMFKVTLFPLGVCGAQTEREYHSMDPRRITCPFCRERAKARNGSDSAPLRLGANIGYLKFTPTATWNPF
jgi:hypothetical protein